MKGIVQNVRRFAADESGLTTVEYAVAGSLITLTMITAFTGLGTQVSGMIESVTALIGG